MKNDYQFENVVSLGWFCSVALENQRMGLRPYSLPFDWLLISNFESVLQLLQTHFSSFLDAKNLHQESGDPAYYHDTAYGIHYYHDFTADKSLEEQLPAVRQKYDRRISRLYETISYPTLFVRYCAYVTEMEYICSNYDAIRSQLKQYNERNEIIFIYDKDFSWRSDITAFFVEPDKGDTTARKFLNKNKKLKQFIRKNVKCSQSTCKSRLLYLKNVMRKIKKKILNVFSS